MKARARLTKVHPSGVRRLNRTVGLPAEAFPDERVPDLNVIALEADQPQGEAEVIDPASQFGLSPVPGRRDEELIRRLREDAAQRLANRHRLVWFTDGETSSASRFPESFGPPYRPSRNGNRGRFPDLRYPIPPTLAPGPIVKHRAGNRVVQVDLQDPHGSQRCLQEVLDQLGCAPPNPAALERRNRTARPMNAHQVRRSLAFSRRPDPKIALGWWGLTVYPWHRPHPSLPSLLAQSQAQKSSRLKHQRWPWDLPTPFGPFGISCSPRFSPPQVRDNLI